MSGGTDFARQLAERDASFNPSATKRFRSSAAPKGTKLRPGYQDRTQLRTSVEEDDKASRIKALEDMVKLGQMDMAIFEKLRDEIVGGDVKDVHLVKGLDWKLLERVKRGEDVTTNSGEPAKTDTPPNSRPGNPEKNNIDIDVDEALEKVEVEEIQPMAKVKQPKKGEMAPASAVAGKKRNRDEILKELKASRLAAAEKAKQPSLGPRFFKIGDKREKPRIEKDDRGREILITVDEEGRVKRKVKRPRVQDDMTKSHGLLMPDKDAKPLGMEVPGNLAPRMPVEEEDEDIFTGVGADYDPLGDDGDDGEDSGDDGEDAKESADNDSELAIRKPKKEVLQTDDDRSKMPPPALPKKTAGGMRNYFGDKPDDHEGEDAKIPPNPLNDPTILAALKKASAINPLSSKQTLSEEEAAKLARREKMLEAHDRDADDLDLGFGSSRFEDGEDAEEKKVKLSVWDSHGGDDGEKGEGKGKRKRGPKKRKGDVNSAADVLKVMEARKVEGK